MMEIAYGPLIVSCALQGLAFGALFALTFPFLERRLFGAPSSGLARRVGLAFAAGGLFGLVQLAVACASDGFPPRIVQSAALALVIVAAAGFALVRLAAAPRTQKQD
jgi:hypothetical protein